MTPKAIWSRPVESDFLDNPHPKIPPMAELFYVGIDLDGTLANSVWKPSDPTDDIGAPIWENVHKAMDLVDAGFKLAIFTARPSADLAAIESWLDHYGIPYRQVYTGKPLLVAMVDDRGIHASHPNWLRAVAEIVDAH